MCDEEEKNTENNFIDGNEVVGTSNEEMVTKKGSSKDTKKIRRERVTFYVNVPGSKKRKKVTFLARRRE